MIIVKKIKQMIITKKKINFFLYAKKSCKKLKLKDLGYTCKELESQKLKKIHTIEKVEKIDWSKCDEEGLAHKPLICYGSDGKLIPKSERIKN